MHCLVKIDTLFSEMSNLIVNTTSNVALINGLLAATDHLAAGTQSPEG